eukprot:7794083-Alexandrium_andersonii.AAC.1
MPPGEGLVSVTTSRDHEAALAYSIPMPAIPAAVAALSHSAEWLAPRLAVEAGVLLLCGAPPALMRAAEEQLGLGRWMRASSPPVQLRRGSGALFGVLGALPPRWPWARPP